MNTKLTECSGMEWKDFLYVIDRLKRQEEYRFMLLIAVGCYFGLRISDILTLRWEQILEGGTFTLVEGKTGKSRKLTVNQSLAELVQQGYQKMKPKPKEYMFRNRAGNSMSIQYVNRKLHRILDDCGIKVANGSSHCLRKTFGKRVWELNDKSEESLVLLSRIFRHSSIAITKIYIGIEEKHIQNVYLSL